MAQSIKHPTLSFGSGHDLMVYEIEPCISLHADSREPAWDAFSLLLGSPPTQAYPLKIDE